MSNALEDPNFDPVQARMVAALEGEAGTWRAVQLALRDAIVDQAVRTTPFYRNVRVDRFEDLPVLTKALVRRHPARFLAEGVPERRRVPKLTSGSSGDPFEFFRDTAQGPMEDFSGRRSLLLLQGIHPWATMVWIAASPLTRPHEEHPRASPMRRAWAALRRRRGPPPPVVTLRTFDLAPERVAEELERWTRLPEYFVYGHASAIDWIADQAEQREIPLARQPVAVVTTSDTLTELARTRIGRVFACPVHSWYGSHEFNGYVAGTVPGTRRYAFNPMLTYAEVVDERGAPVPAGTSGRLLVTDLNNRVMPFIRYDTGDRATAASDAHGGWPVMQSLDGRDSELLTLPGGRPLSGTTLGVALFRVGTGAGELSERIRFYQCAQLGPDRLELRVVWRGSPSERDAEAAARRLREAFGADLRVQVRSVQALERLPSGKTWIVRREPPPA